MDSEAAAIKSSSCDGQELGRLMFMRGGNGPVQDSATVDFESGGLQALKHKLKKVVSKRSYQVSTTYLSSFN